MSPASESAARKPNKHGHKRLRVGRGAVGKTATSGMETQMNFLTPPENQGQIVTVSYAMWDGRVYRHTHDASDGSTEYAVSPALDGDEGDYQNGAPANKRWKAISAEEVEDAALGRVRRQKRAAKKSG